VSEADGSACKGAGQTGERIDQERREALTRLAQYTAPAMLAVLMSTGAAPAVSGVPKMVLPP
jgi:hypothetical protein